MTFSTIATNATSNKREQDTTFKVSGKRHGDDEFMSGKTVV